MSEYVGARSSAYPFSGVCYIVADFGNGNRNAATGFMVGPNDVLTASHVVYDVDYGGLADTITVHPGYDGGTAPFGAYRAVTVDHLIADPDGDGLMSRADSEKDFALLGLDTRVGDTTGAFTLDPDGAAVTFAFTGYPSTYRVGRDAKMVTDTGTAIEDTDDAVYNYISIETNTGNSGGPLWYTGADGGAMAVGVASTSDWAAAVAAQYDRIVQWIAGNDGAIVPDPGTPEADGQGATVAAGGSDVGAAFDAAWYLARYDDVADAGIDALAHFLSYGWREGRDPNAWFDTDGYRAAYPDAAGADMDPLTHYQRYGWAEERDPSALFDTSVYLGTNPDVAGFADGALAHYIQFGADEGRTVAPSADPAWETVA
jgi:V8-like Glu-specific endopeptidase